MSDLNFSACTEDRILKVAPTIADLWIPKIIEPHHIPEAIQYWTLDRQVWT